LKPNRNFLKQFLKKYIEIPEKITKDKTVLSFDKRKAEQMEKAVNIRQKYN